MDRDLPKLCCSYYGDEGTLIVARSGSRFGPQQPPQCFPRPAQRSRCVAVQSITAASILGGPLRLTLYLYKSTQVQAPSSQVASCTET